MLAHGELRPFKPTGKGGGSKKGKIQGEWPWVLKVVADAILTHRAKGSSDAWKIDRRQGLTNKELGRRVDIMCPGWREEVFCGQKTPLPELLGGRVYKMYYSGTSDRGKGHDPETRACESNEHWLKHFHIESQMGQLHQAIVKGLPTVDNWKDYI